VRVRSDARRRRRSDFNLGVVELLLAVVELVVGFPVEVAHPHVGLDRGHVSLLLSAPGVCALKNNTLKEQKWKHLVTL
jgi:hypothetical protein